MEQKCKTTQFFKGMNPEFGHSESDGLKMMFRCSKDFKVRLEIVKKIGALADDRATLIILPS